MLKQEPLQPQEGFQVDALSTPADIAILGGAAGAGKSFVLLMESLRGVQVPGYTGIIFRRTSPQIKSPGALLDASRKVYPRLNGRLREVETEWRFPVPNGFNTIKFSHMQYDKDTENHQGAEYAFVGFDELCHFTENQFWFMMSRMRSTSGVKPYMRATCNPDADSFVASLIEWYIDQDTGYPIPERAGVLRYFIRLGGVITWGNSKKEVYDQVKNDQSFFEELERMRKSGGNWTDLIKSFTFIPGSVYDNKKLLSVDPGYVGNLLALNKEEQDQLLRGNWKISVDGLSLCEFSATNMMFSNYATPSQYRCITCDAARFGKDLMVIFVWRGWEVVKIIVMSKSDANDIVKALEEERRTWGVMKRDVLVDQDGVGGGVVKLGGYAGFHGGHAAVYDRDTAIKEQYDNLKTQCAYRVAEENINTGEIRISITDENVVIDGVRSTKIKVNKMVRDVRDLIKDDVRAWKRKPRSKEGKLLMNNKDEQKLLIGGRSPDFGDNILMRKYLDIRPRAAVVTYN